MTAEIGPDAGHVDRLLPAYLNGTLAPGERDEALQHLDRCAACRAELAAWEAIRAASRAYGEIALSARATRPPGAPRRHLRLASSPKETGMTSFSSIPLSPGPFLDIPRLPALPGKPARRAWPLANLATAALLLLTLAVSFATLQRDPSSGGVDAPAGIVPAVAPDRLAFPGLRDDTVLLHGVFPVLPKFASWAGIEEATLNPGADTPLGTSKDSGEGPLLYLVEAGALTIQAEGPIAITRAGSAQPVTLPAGMPAVLQPGDRGFTPSGVTSRWRNDGAIPAKVLWAGIQTSGILGLNQPTVVLRHELIFERLLTPLPEPAAVAVRRITLDAGTAMPASAILGLRMLAVESGTLEAITPSVAGSATTPLPITRATVDDPFFTPDTIFRSVGSEPAALLVMTIAPADPLRVLPPAISTTPVPSRAADGITPLMQATVDGLPVNPTVVWASRTVYQPGAAEPLTPYDGPVLTYVERGEVALAADAPVLVGKPANAPGAIEAPASASNPSLGPGAWAVVPGRVSSGFRNVGLDEASVLMIGIANENNVLSGSPDNPGATGSLLGTLTGEDMPPAPATISVGRATLGPGASLPAVPPDTRRLVVPDRANSGVGMGMDGSARNLTKAPLVVDVITIVPAAKSANTSAANS